MKKKLINVVMGVALGATLTMGSALASYDNYGGNSAEEFTFIGNAWLPGADTVRGFNPDGSDPAAPGGATWSLMDLGLGDGNGDDPHGGAVTTDFLNLLGQTDTQAETYINAILDVWANDSGFSNLGRVADGGVNFGESNANGGHLGDIRIGSIFIDGNVGGNVLAHAYSPCNFLCGPGGQIGGDMHIDNSNDWVDGAGAGLDLFTVMLHEFGHSLGLGHSAVVGSIMEATYAGVRRTLHADDTAAVQAVYGATVPAPAAVWLFATALGLLGFTKERARNNFLK